MTVQIAPLQTYQGPALNPVGGFLAAKDAAQQGALQREELAMRKEDRAMEQEGRAKMQGILSEMEGGKINYEQAALSLLPYDPQMANSILNMETHKQQGALNQQNMQMNSLKMAQAKIEQKKAQIQMEAKFGQSVLTALDGVEEPSEKEGIYSLILAEAPDMGIKIPEVLQGGWSPEKEKTLRGLLEYSTLLLESDPTTMQQNYDFLNQKNPELAKAFLEKEAGLTKDAPTPHSDLAKLTADYKNGLITKEQYDSQSKTAVSGAPKDAFEGEDKLRDEYNTLSKDFFEVERAYNRIQASVQDPSPAGDMALIFNYMKMLDPGSTVREGEYATAQNAASIPEVVRAKYNKAMEGVSLSDKQRSDFSERATKLWGSAKKSQDPVKKRYEDMAKRYSLNPENIIGTAMAEAPGEETQFTAENPAKPTTQEEYDALPKGSYFMDDEGLKVK